MVYSIAAYFDKDVEKFNPPMLFPFGRAEVSETIKDGVLKGKIEGAESFDLFYLGTYDTETAKFDLLEKPSKDLVLSDYVKGTKQS